MRASPVALGVGTITAAHGMLPNPAPAVVELLRGAPTFGVDIALELTTPTGAALLAALATALGPVAADDAPLRRLRRRRPRPAGPAQRHAGRDRRRPADRPALSRASR